MSQHEGRDTSTGATPIGPPAKKRPAWLIPLALLILLVILLLLLLSRCGSDDDKSSAATPTATPAATATTAAAPTVTAAGTGSGSADVTQGDAGTLFAGSDPVLPMAAATQIGSGGSLSAYTGQAATATAVSVQSVPADEGFWVGSDAQDRVWVQLTGQAGESSYKVKQGDRVSFTGKVTDNGTGFAQKAGVTDAEGQKLLDAQGQHIDVLKSALKLSS